MQMLTSVQVALIHVVNTATTPLTPTSAAVAVVSFSELINCHVMVNDFAWGNCSI